MLLNRNANGSDANLYGGGMFCMHSNSINVENCIIIENEAYYNGGGIYDYNSSSLIIKNSNISDNKAIYGGGIYNKYCSANLINCVFTDNSATAFGCGMYNDHSSHTLINCVFTENTSTSDYSRGGGMYNDQSSPAIINCTFSGNSVDTWGKGGAICNTNSSEPNMTNSIFENNSAWDGGAVYNDDSEPNITYCIFTGNNAIDYGGAVYSIASSPKIANSIFTCNTVNPAGASLGAGIHNYQSSATIDNCIFSGNISDYGCGISNYQSSTTTKITNCMFNGNHANVLGGGMYNYQSSPTLIKCVFSGNLAGYGGAICNLDDSDPNITKCIFSNNSANEGGGVYNNCSDPNITNCVFGGNDADNFGGGMVNCYGLSLTITNCIFNGNYAGSYGGGGIGNFDQMIVLITNCTFSGNYASGSYGGGAMCNWESGPVVTNCILWYNEADTVYDEIYNDGSSYPVISYSDIKGGWTGGTGNKDEDPCFFEVDTPTGSWTANPSYDESTFQSTLTDDSASWTVNQLAGKFINPDTLNQDLHFFIVSNDVNTINVWSNAEYIETSGKTYKIYDYHLKVESPCIDAGDPQGDYNGQKDIDGEPRVFDGDYNDSEIVDMGADEYYWSPADFNSDGLVNFFDYALIANVWLTTPTYQYYNDVYDLIDNDCIDSNDLARFCEDWLWQTAWAKTFPFAYYQAMGRGMDKSMAESLGFTQDLFTSVSAGQNQPELTAADIEEIIKWLYDLWLTEDQLRKMITADDWLKFIDQVIELAKQEIQY
jgi:hypothetical protein